MREFEPNAENEIYCNKGSHRKRSIFHRALVRAERMGLEKADLVLTEDISRTSPPLYPTETVPTLRHENTIKTE